MMMKNTLLLCATIFGLSACAGPFNGEGQALSVEKAHPIAVNSQTVTLTINVDPMADELSNIDKARLRAFGETYLRNGHGPVTVTAPSGDGGEFIAEEAAADARQYLNTIGVSWDAMTGATYRVGVDSPQQLILSFTKYVATPSACGVWAGVKAADRRNLRSPNFGCATQNNLAAMVADPRDLIMPADETSADSTARIRAIDAFREGEVSAVATDGEVKASSTE